MEQVIGFPCPKCKRLTDGIIISKAEGNQTYTIIRFKAECCDREITHFFTKHDMTRYIKEVWVDKYDPNICPVCHKPYTPDNWRSHHHIYPKRFFQGEGELFELCRNCHNRLELLIPIRQLLAKQEYIRILNHFITHHCAKRFRRKRRVA